MQTDSTDDKASEPSMWVDDLAQTIQRQITTPKITHGRYANIPPTTPLLASGNYPDGGGTPSKKRLNGNFFASNKLLTFAERFIDGRVYKGVPNEWMPDVIPAETYVHHTLQRSLQLPPQILSPVPVPYQHQPPPNNIVNSYTNPHNGRYGDTLTRQQGGGTPHSTLGRLSRNSNANTLRFGSTIDDEMNDAYYTYTARKTKVATPATTFN